MDEPRWCPGVKDLTQQHMTVTSDFYVRRNRGVKKIDNICKDCRKKHTARWRRNNPEKVRTYQKRYDAKLDREARRTYQRENYRMVYGKGAWTWKRYRIDYDIDHLPVEPFQEWLRLNIVPLLASPGEVRSACSENLAGSDSLTGLTTWASIADHAGVNRKTLPNYLSGKTKTVPRELVDRIGLLFGNMNLSDELYDEENHEEAA